VTPGEQYRQDLKRQKQQEKRAKAEASWKMRQAKVREKYTKDIKKFKLNVLYKVRSVPDTWRFSSCRYFIVRDRGTRTESMLLDILCYENGQYILDQRALNWSECRHNLIGNFDPVIVKKERTKVILRGLVP
jgi:t-SNARE complex subunit (syntaxin)